MIIVDRASYKELFSAPNEELHFMHATLEDFDFTAVFRADIHNPTHTNAVKADLNSAIPSITPFIADEVQTMLDEDLSRRIEEGCTALT